MNVKHRHSIDELTTRINEFTTADEQRYHLTSKVADDDDDDETANLFDDQYQFDEP